MSGRKVKSLIVSSLAQNGCLFVVDGISLLHSQVREMFQRSLVGVEPHAVFLVSPRDFRKQELSALLERYMAECYPRFFHEHDVQLSPHYRFLIGNGIEFRRSLRVSLRELDLTDRIPQSWRRQFLLAGISAPGIEQNFMA